MYVLYEYTDAEQQKNSWDYGGDVGYISKGSQQSKKDQEQDEKINENAQAIADNEGRDDDQQSQIDANTQAIADNESRDDSQQSQIDETIRRLNENIENDGQQQQQIINNTTNITRIENELPTMELDGTTLVIGKRGDS